MFERPCIARQETYLKANNPKLQDQTDTIMNEKNNQDSKVEVDKAQRNVQKIIYQNEEFKFSGGKNKQNSCAPKKEQQQLSTIFAAGQSQLSPQVRPDYEFEKPTNRFRPQTPIGKNDKAQLREKRIDFYLQKDARASRLSLTPDKKA